MQDRSICSRLKMINIRVKIQQISIRKTKIQIFLRGPTNNPVAYNFQQYQDDSRLIKLEFLKSRQNKMQLFR